MTVCGSLHLNIVLLRVEYYKYYYSTDTLVFKCTSSYINKNIFKYSILVQNLGNHRFI